MRHLAMFCTFLFVLINIATSNVLPSRLGTEPPALGSPNQGPTQQLPSHHLQHRDQITPVTTEISPYQSFAPDDRAVESALAKRQERLIRQFRVATMFILWSGTRLNSIINSSPHADGKVYQSLKNMYTQIRHAAINKWAKLPERSFLHITCGQLIFTILPPADRTVPWTVVEEVAYTLLLMTAAGLGGLVSGMYATVVATSVVWWYLAIIVPGPEEQIPRGRTGRVAPAAPVIG